VPLPDVAHQVTVCEHTDPPDSEKRERLAVYDSLVDDHLPVLCDAHFVDYDTAEDTIERGTAAGRIESLVKRHLENEIDALLRAERQSMPATGDETSDEDC
jgi:hypothetical protein